MSPSTFVRRALIFCLSLAVLLPAVPARAAGEFVPVLQQDAPSAPVDPTLFSAATEIATAEVDEAEPAATLAGAESAVVQIEAVGTFVDMAEGLQANAAGYGSGFIIDPSGIAVTNNHVVTGGALFRVYLDGYDRPLNARVLGVSECADLAVIDIQGSGFPFLGWHEGPITVGMDVYAAGFPLGDPEYTLTRGIVSKARASGDTNWASVGSVLQHDAEIEPGNSGGPLLDANGRVVGINYRHNRFEQYFAISRDEALPILEQLRAGLDVDSIGINGEAYVDADGFSGIWVASVQSGSPADTVGILPGDLILTLEGVTLAEDGTMATYCDILRSHDPTDVMAVEVARFETEEVLKGQLNGRPLQQSFSFAEAVEEQTAGGTNVSSPGPAPIYASFVTISDERGILSAEVPAEWDDIVETAWTMGEDEREVGISIYIAPDLDAFAEDWAIPGVVLRYSESLAGEMDAEALLDDVDYSQECTFTTRETVPDGYYDAAFDLWEECGEAASMALVVAMVAQDGRHVVRLELYATTEEDLDALDHILDTFAVVPPSGQTRQNLRQPRYSTNVSIEGVRTTNLSYEYALVEDRALSFLAPVTWSDSESGDWIIDGEVMGRQFAIALDLVLFNSTWTAPGVNVYMAEGINASFNPVAALDAIDYTDTCDYVDRVPHEHMIYGIRYSGTYDVWENCGGRTNTMIVLVAKSTPADHVILLSFFAVTDADLEAFSVLEESFYVETAVTAPLIERGSTTPVVSTTSTTPATPAGYTVLIDEDDAASIAVPNHWIDTVNSGWVFDGARVGRSISAAPDMDAFRDLWGSPGFFLGVSDFLGEEYTPEDFLDEFEFYDACVYDDRGAFINEIVDGVYDVWLDCGGIEGSSFLVYAAVGVDDPDVLVFLYALLPDPADRPIFDALLASLTLGGAPAPAPVTPSTPVTPTEPDPQPDPEPEDEGTGLAEVVVDALNVRSGPGTNYPRVGGVRRGQLLIVLGQYNACSWLFIVSEDAQVGWVSGSSDYIALDAPCSVIPAMEAPPPPSEPSQPPQQPQTPQQPAQQPVAPNQPNADLGCFLFQNQLGPELTITFTQVGGGFNVTIHVGSTDVEQCFPPGRYTYTLDAPPPWGSTNGEIEIFAGDRYLFPIRPAN